MSIWKTGRVMMSDWKIARSWSLPVKAGVVAMLAACAPLQSQTPSLQPAAETESVIPDRGDTWAYYATSVMIPMRDGVSLAGNLILPGDGEPAPVVISITPYGRHAGHWAGAATASAGMASLFVDTRGRGDS